MTSSADNAASWKKYARLGLIPALGGVLLAVVFWPAAKAEPIGKKQPKPVVAAVVEKTEAGIENSAPVVRPSFTLDDALADNVFNPLNPNRKLAADGSVLPAEGSAAAEPVQELPPSQVQAIFKNASGRAAIIDSRVVRVGDVVASGRVVEITDNNVFIAPE